MYVLRWFTWDRRVESKREGRFLERRASLCKARLSRGFEAFPINLGGFLKKVTFSSNKSLFYRIEKEESIGISFIILSIVIGKFFLVMKKFFKIFKRHVF